MRIVYNKTRFFFFYSKSCRINCFQFFWPQLVILHFQLWLLCTIWKRMKNAFLILEKQCGATIFWIALLDDSNSFSDFLLKESCICIYLAGVIDCKSCTREGGCRFPPPRALFDANQIGVLQCIDPIFTLPIFRSIVRSLQSWGGGETTPKVPIFWSTLGIMSRVLSSNTLAGVRMHCCQSGIRFLWYF